MNQTQIDLLLKLQDQASAPLRAAMERMSTQITALNAQVSRQATALASQQKAFQGSTSAIRDASTALEAHGETMNATLSRIQRSLVAFGAIFALREGIQLLGDAIYGFNAQIETSTLGVATSLLSQGRYIDEATGKALNAQEALGAAQSEAVGILESLQVANLQTIATFDQLVRAFQETLPVAMRTGFDVEQTKNFTVAMVQAAGAIDASGRLMEHLGEETRALLTGAIRTGQSRIAAVLGVTNEDVARFKGDAQGLFDFLMEKLAAYRLAGIESQKTWAGLVSNVTDLARMQLGKAFEPAFVFLKKELQDIADLMGKVDEKTGKMVWNPEFLAQVEDFREGLTGALQTMKAWGTAIANHAGLIENLIKLYVGLKAAQIAAGWAQGIKSSVGAGVESLRAVAAARAAAAELSLAESLVIVRKTELDAANIAVYHTTQRLRAMNADMASVGAKNMLAAAMTRQTAAAGLLATAETGLVAAQGAAAATGTMAGRMLGLLGGPIGTVTTLLGLTATAWWMLGNEAESAAEKAQKAGRSVIADLEEELRLLEERNRIGGRAGVPTDAELRRLAVLSARQKEIQRLLTSPEVDAWTRAAANPSALQAEFARNKAEIARQKELRERIGERTRQTERQRPAGADVGAGTGTGAEEDGALEETLDQMRRSREWFALAAKTSEAAAEEVLDLAKNEQEWMDAVAAAQGQRVSDAMAAAFEAAGTDAMLDEPARRAAQALRAHLWRMAEEGLTQTTGTHVSSMIVARRAAQALPETWQVEAGGRVDWTSMEALARHRQDNVLWKLQAGGATNAAAVIARWDALSAAQDAAMDGDKAKNWSDAVAAGVGQLGDVFGRTASMMHQLWEDSGKQSDKLFKWYKTMAMAETAISTAQAIMNVWAGPLGKYPPAAMAMSLAVGALGAAQLGMISRQQPTPMATGGVFTRPTFLVGEAGHEAFVPLDRYALMDRNAARATTVHVKVNQNVSGVGDRDLLRQVAAISYQGGRAGAIEALGGNDSRVRRNVQRMARR